MSALADYVAEHTRPAPTPHEGDIDVIFFRVQVSPSASVDRFRQVLSAQVGEFCDVKPLDGQEHSYLELGAWVGSQELALRLMALGSGLGIWKLWTPYTVLGANIQPELARKMAENGLVTIVAIDSLPDSAERP